MTPPVLELVESIQGARALKPRVGLTELARSKTWQKNVAEYHVVELTDHNETAGWILSPDGMDALLGRISELEAELEARQIEDLFETRAEYVNLKSGEELRDEALSILAQRTGEIEELLNAS